MNVVYPWRFICINAISLSIRKSFVPLNCGFLPISTFPLLRAAPTFRSWFVSAIRTPSSMCMACVCMYGSDPVSDSAQRIARWVKYNRSRRGPTGPVAAGSLPVQLVIASRLLGTDLTPTWPTDLTHSASRRPTKRQRSSRGAYLWINIGGW